MCTTYNVFLIWIVQAYMAPGVNDGGFLVCKFVFKVSSEGFMKTSHLFFPASARAASFADTYRRTYR